MSAEQARRIADRYEIVRPLASGSMGQVYIARHAVTEQLVALKLLHNETRRDPASIERFLREVRVGARIGHDGVVKVLDAGVDPAEGTPYLAMELLEGESLYDRLQREGITQHTGLQLIAQILEPLAAAHAKGIVHRDLKPENVFIAKRYDGAEQVKILDFGIAREVGSKSATATGVAVGTPYYMSPEQATKPRDVGAATDVWAMGVMLYEILCGAVPFDGESVHAVIIAACTQPHTDPLWIAPELDPRLAAILDKCLAKNPADRFQSAGELLAELKTVVNDARVSRSLSMRAVKAGSLPASGVIAGQSKSGARDVALPLAGTVAASSSGVMRTSGVPGTQASSLASSTRMGLGPGASQTGPIAAPGDAAPLPVPVEPSARSSAPAVQASGSQPIATVVAAPARRSMTWAYVLGAVLALAGLGAVAAIALGGGDEPGVTAETPAATAPAALPAATPTVPAPPASPATTTTAATATAPVAPAIAPRAAEASPVTATPATAPASAPTRRRRTTAGADPASGSATATPTTTETVPATVTAPSPATGTGTGTTTAETGTTAATRPATTTATGTTTATTTARTGTTTTTARTGTTTTTGRTTTTTTRPGTTTTTRPPTKTRRQDPGVLTF